MKIRKLKERELLLHQTYVREKGFPTWLRFCTLYANDVLYLAGTYAVKPRSTCSQCNKLTSRTNNERYSQGTRSRGEGFLWRRQDVNARAFPTKSRVHLADENVSFFNGRVKGAFVLSKRMYVNHWRDRRYHTFALSSRFPCFPLLIWISHY